MRCDKARTARGALVVLTALVAALCDRRLRRLEHSGKTHDEQERRLDDHDQQSATRQPLRPSPPA